MSPLIWSEGSDQRVKSTDYLILGRSEFSFDLETEGEVIDRITDVPRMIHTPRTEISILTWVFFLRDTRRL